MKNDIIIEVPWHKKLEQLRSQRGWIQSQAAEKCLTHNKIYWLWEKGKCYPRLRSRKDIARAYGLKIDGIFPACDEKKMDRRCSK